MTKDAKAPSEQNISQKTFEQFHCISTDKMILRREFFSQVGTEHGASQLQLRHMLGDTVTYSTIRSVGPFWQACPH